MKKQKIVRDEVEASEEIEIQNSPIELRAEKIIKSKLLDGCRYGVKHKEDNRIIFVNEFIFRNYLLTTSEVKVFDLQKDEDLQECIKFMVSSLQSGWEY